MASRGKPLSTYVFIALAATTSSFVLYSNTLSAQFVYDDTRAIVSNADLRPSSPWSVLVTNDFWGTPLRHSGSHKSFRPVCTATFRLNYLFGELEPFGYHLVNVVLHALSCLLVVFVCIHVFSGKVSSILVASMMFAVHPIHCEAVAGIVGRADVLACIFFLLAFLFHLKAAGCSVMPSPFSHHRTLNHDVKMTLVHTIGWMSCISTCTALSMFSKESGITVLGVVVLYDLFILTLPSLELSAVKQIMTNKRYFLFRVRLFFCVLSGVLLLVLRFQVMGHSPPSFSPSDNPAASADSILTRTLTFFYLPSFNMWLLLYPKTLSFDWSMDTVPLIQDVTDMRNVSTLILYIGLIGLTLFTIGKIKASKSSQFSTENSSTSMFSNMHSPFALNLQANMNTSNRNVPVPPNMNLKMRYPTREAINTASTRPTLQVVQVTKFSKCSSIAAQALLIGLAFLVLPFLPASNLVFHVGFVVAERVLYIPSLGFCILVAHGVTVLYEECCKGQIRKVLLGLLCACSLIMLSVRTYQRNSDWYNEESLYRSGIESNPAKAWGNLGNTLTTSGRHDEAENAYKNAIHHRPNMADAHYNYGTLLLNQGKYEEASRKFQDAITYRPKLAAAYLNLGIVLTNMKREKDAKKVYQDCSVLSDEGLKNPKGHMTSVTNCLFNLGKLLIEENSPEEAITHLLKASEVAPSGYGYQGVYNLLGEAYVTIGQAQKSEHYFKQSLVAKAGHLPAVFSYAKFLQNQARSDEALKILSEGKRYHPDRPEVFLQEGSLYLTMKDILRARESFDSAISLSSQENVEIVVSAGHSFREIGSMEDAERYYRLAVERQPKSPMAHSNLGAFLHLTHKYQEAEVHYLKSLELNPGDKLTKENLKKMRLALAKSKL